MFAGWSAKAARDVIGVVLGVDPRYRVPKYRIICGAEAVIGEELQAAWGLVQQLGCALIIYGPGIHGSGRASGDTQLLYTVF